MFRPCQPPEPPRPTSPPGHPPRLLLGLTGALLALLILNLAVFDDLRVDPSAGALETFTKPQHLASLIAVLVAATLLAFKHHAAARVAVAVAWIEIAAFTFFHVIPVEVGPSKPYWGDGMGDTLQWAGLLSIIGVSAAIVLAVRRSHEPPRHAGRRERTVTTTDNPQTLARITGVLFLITFVTSIVASVLFQPVLDDPGGYIAGAGADTRIYLGALLELLLIVANVGTAVALFPILKRQSEGLTVGYLAARLVECTFIAIGLLSVLAVVSLRNGPPGADNGALAHTLAAIKDWTFLLGPGFVAGLGNGLDAGLSDVPVRLDATPHGDAGPRRRAAGLRLGDRRSPRRAREGRLRTGTCDAPGSPLGGVARHLPHRQGLQAGRGGCADAGARIGPGGQARGALQLPGRGCAPSATGSHDLGRSPRLPLITRRGPPRVSGS